jgi:hypothetical protein
MARTNRERIARRIESEREAIRKVEAVLRACTPRLRNLASPCDSSVRPQPCKPFSAPLCAASTQHACPSYSPGICVKPGAPVPSPVPLKPYNSMSLHSVNGVPPPLLPFDSLSATSAHTTNSDQKQPTKEKPSSGNCESSVPISDAAAAAEAVVDAAIEAGIYLPGAPALASRSTPQQLQPYKPMLQPPRSSRSQHIKTSARNVLPELSRGSREVQPLQSAAPGKNSTGKSSEPQRSCSMPCPSTPTRMKHSERRSAAAQGTAVCSDARTTPFTILSCAWQSQVPEGPLSHASQHAADSPAAARQMQQGCKADSSVYTPQSRKAAVCHGHPIATPTAVVATPPKWQQGKPQSHTASHVAQISHSQQMQPHKADASSHTTQPCSPASHKLVFTVEEANLSSPNSKFELHNKQAARLSEAHMRSAYTSSSPTNNNEYVQFWLTNSCSAMQLEVCPGDGESNAGQGRCTEAAVTSAPLAHRSWKSSEAPYNHHHTAKSQGNDEQQAFHNESHCQNVNVRKASSSQNMLAQQVPSQHKQEQEASRNSLSTEVEVILANNFLGTQDHEMQGQRKAASMHGGPQASSRAPQVHHQGQSPAPSFAPDAQQHVYAQNVQQSRAQATAAVSVHKGLTHEAQPPNSPGRSGMDTRHAPAYTVNLNPTGTHLDGFATGCLHFSQSGSDSPPQSPVAPDNARQVSVSQSDHAASEGFGSLLETSNSAMPATCNAASNTDASLVHSSNAPACLQMPVQSPSPEGIKADGPLQASLQSMNSLQIAQTTHDGPADESADLSDLSQDFDAKTALAHARQRACIAEPLRRPTTSEQVATNQLLQTAACKDSATEVARVEEWLRKTGMRRGWDLSLLDELLSQDLAAVLAAPAISDCPGQEQQHTWNNPIALRSFVQQCASHTRQQQSLGDSAAAPISAPSPGLTGDWETIMRCSGALLTDSLPSADAKAHPHRDLLRMSFELLDTGVVASTQVTMPDGPLAATQTQNSTRVYNHDDDNIPDSCGRSAWLQQRVKGREKADNRISCGQMGQFASTQHSFLPPRVGRVSPLKSAGPASAAFAPLVGVRAGRLASSAKTSATHTPGKGLKIASGYQAATAATALTRVSEVLPLTRSRIWGKCETRLDSGFVGLLRARRDLRSHRCALY